MGRNIWRLGVPVAVVALLALLLGVRAQGTKQEEKVIKGGKAEAFKGKTFDLEEKGKVKIALDFPADKEATVTVRSKKKSDVNLYIYNDDKKVVAKDDSPGPSCDIAFTPKEAGTYVVEIRNLGPGDNTSTLKVEYGKKKVEDKEKEKDQ